MKNPNRVHWLAALAGLLLCTAGCDPCADYCALECSCNYEDSESCQQTCMETLEVYTGEARDSECFDRQELLEEDCG